MAEHPLDRVAAEAARIVARVQGHAAPDQREQREGDARPLHGARVADRQASGALLERVLDRVVLEHDHALEERRAAENPAPPLHLDEPVVLVVAQLDLLPLQSVQEGAHRHVGVHLHAHDERVDEHADHPVDARQRCRAARDGRAEHHVPLPGIPREEDRPRSLHEGARCDLLLPRERREAVREVIRQCEPGVCPACLPRGGVIDPKRCRRGEAIEPTPPECFRRGAVLLAQPGDELAVGTRPIEPGLGASRVRVVQREDLLDEDRRRPAVEDQVVAAPEEAVGVVGDPEEGDAHQRRPGQIEAAPAVLLGEALDLALLLARGETTQVALVHRERRVLAHDLHGPLDPLP